MSVALAELFKHIEGSKYYMQDITQTYQTPQECAKLAFKIQIVIQKWSSGMLCESWLWW